MSFITNLGAANKELERRKSDADQKKKALKEQKMEVLDKVLPGFRASRKLSGSKLSMAELAQIKARSGQARRRLSLTNFTSTFGAERRMSLQSTALVSGAFPDAAKAPQPTINAAFYIRGHPHKRTVHRMCKRLLRFSRFRSAPDLIEEGTVLGFGSDLWAFTEVGVDLDKHIFVHFADDEQALHAMVEAYTVQELEITRDKPAWEVHVFKLRMSEEEAKHIHELETKEHLAGEDDADSVSSGGSFSRKMSRTSAGKHRLRISERKASTFDRTGTKLDEVVPEVTPAPTLHVPEQNTHSADEEKVAEGEGDNNTNKDTPAEEAPNATIGAAKEALKHLDDEANQGEDRADEVTYVPRPFHSVALFKIHHCIGDGIGLVEVLKEIIHAKVMTFRKQGSGKLRRNEGSCSLACKAFNSICKISSMTLPWASFDSPISFTGGAEAGHLARGSGCMGTSPAPLTYSGKRSTVHFPEVSLQLIKEIKSKIGNSCSVNDVLLGVVGGVLRRLSESRNDPLLGDNQMVNRCLIPFAFPRGAESIDDDHDGPRNMWTMVSAAIPVTGTSAVKRVKMAQRTMKEIKQSPDAYVAQWIQENGLSTKDLVHGLFARHTCVFTNVPGPTEEIRFGGAKVKGIQMLFPNIIPQLSVLSYANKMYFNFNIDKEVCKGWEQLPQFYMEELAELANDLDLDKKLVAFEHISSRGGPFHRSRHEAQGDLNAPKLAAATAPKMVTSSTNQRTFKAPSSRSGQQSEEIASLEA